METNQMYFLQILNCDITNDDLFEECSHSCPIKWGHEQYMCWSLLFYIAELIEGNLIVCIPTNCRETVLQTHTYSDGRVLNEGDFVLV